MKITKQHLKKLIKEQISLMELGDEEKLTDVGGMETGEVEGGYHQQTEIKRMLQALLDHFGIDDLPSV
jgi:hypothetical protein